MTYIATHVSGSLWRVDDIEFGGGHRVAVRAGGTAEDAIAAFLESMSPPPPTAADVRAEAQRRIIALVGATDFNSCIVKQLNANMRGTELVNKVAMGGTLTTAEAAEAATLQALADGIKAIRAASNVMESAPPADYADNSRWP